MRYENSRYNVITKEIIDIYCDYKLSSFPVDPFHVCKLLCISLVKYSAYDGEDLEVLMKKSKKGFRVPGTRTVFYNDIISSENTEMVIRYTLFHEIKHVVFDDEEEDDEIEDMAEFFSRYFMCPIPYLMVLRPSSYLEIISTFHMSKKAAENAYKNYVSRINKTGYGIYKKEMRLMKVLLGDDYQEENFEKIDGAYYFKKCNHFLRKK